MSKSEVIIADNLHRSAMYSGRIQSRGPRYCPSIEDKVVRFAHKNRHQVFLEPEGLDSEEIYVNGLSTSLPRDVQMGMLRTVPGLEAAEFLVVADLFTTKTVQAAHVALAGVRTMDRTLIMVSEYPRATTLSREK